MYTIGGIYCMLPSSESNYQPVKDSQTKLDQFLVCGLGSLGQHCVAILKEYGAVVNAIDQEEPKNWQVPNLLDLLEQLLIGDCRQTSILEQANISQCRTILLVTGNERVNIEAAFAARLLNPQVRLVVRSDKQNLNELLSQNLGNFIAFEPNQISASGFAIAALGDENLGCFQLEGHQLRVVKHQIKASDQWSNKWRVCEMNTLYRRVLNHTNNPSYLPQEFHQWEPEARLQPGDIVIYLEVTEQLKAKQLNNQPKYNLQQLWQEIVLGRVYKNLKQKIAYLWQTSDRYQSLRVAIICGITVFFLWCFGTVIYSLNYPDTNIVEAFYGTAMLLLGGYGDLFGGINFKTPPELAERMPGWLRLFSLGLTVIGIGFVGVLYALLTNALLSSRFQFFNNYQPLMPKNNYVVLIGLNRVGQRVAALLQELKQPLVGISSTAVNADFINKIPLIIGNISDALGKVNLANTKSIVVVTDDDMENLEIALMAHVQSPTTHVVIRTYDRYFSDNVARLFPYAQVLCTSAISAEVFAAAAFGENILSVFHFDTKTILVVEYMIEAGDTLNELLLAEVAYGYGVVPILYQKSKRSPVKLMPTDHTRLAVGDRLIVLANSNSLQRIERGEIFPRTWQVQVEKVLAQDAIFDGANEISLISGCKMSTARKLMNNLPGQLPIALYKQQALYLVRRLSKLRVTAHLKPFAQDTE
ncbi:potassium channel family protein [Komarekiella delphini-convector]|uniref:potassium channel family protein n=1 Tax=Komarekiella delphini-convector TaxID=3050158 RepID=UPI001CD8C73D|nr:NAD-binding protein [Komarekiella delphini-convector]